MSKRTQENIVAFLFLIFFIVMLVISHSYNEKARMVPIPIAYASIFFLLIQMYFMNFRQDINLNVDATELLTGGKTEDEVLEAVHVDDLDEVPIEKAKAGGSEKGAIIMMVSYSVLAALIGILGGTLLFVTGFLRFVTKLNWVVSLLTGMATAVAIWFFFSYILEVRFFQGYLLELFLG